MNKRFKDPNYSMRMLAAEIWVHCPKCEKKAIIFYHFNPIEIHCEYCGYHEKNNRYYFNLELKRHCSTCGKHFQFFIPNIRTKKENIIVSCPHCQTAESYKPRYDLSQYPRRLPFDAEPFYFNSRLWLQKTVKGQRFFALNGRHLQYLKNFIAADLREKNDSYNKTILAYLPAFIKSKKNRPVLLKIIRQLEEKALL